LAGKATEVKDNLLALPNGQEEHLRGDGLVKEAGTRRDDLEGQLCARRRRLGNVQSKVSTYGRVEQTESMFAGLYIHVGPRLAIDMNRVSPDAVELVLGVSKGPIAVIVL